LFFRYALRLENPCSYWIFAAYEYEYEKFLMVCMVEPR